MTDEEKKKLAEEQEGDDEEDQDEDETLEDDIDLEDDDVDEGGESDGENDGEEGEEDDDSEDEEDEETDFSEQDLEDPEKRKLALAELKKSKSALKQRRIWKERAIKAGWEKNKQQKPPVKKTKKSAAYESQAAVVEARQLNDLTNFRLDNPGIPRKMVSEIQKYAVAHEMTMEQAMKRPLIQRFVNDKKLRARLSKASPNSRHRDSQTASPKDWSKATPAEVTAHRAEINRRASNR